MPSKSTRPPRLPAPGPRSITWSAASIASGSCSTTTTVLPRSASLRRMASSRRVSTACRPIVGSSSTYRVPVSDAAERRGEADALRLPARERARRARRGSGSRGRRRSCSGRGTRAPRARSPRRSCSAGEGASSAKKRWRSRSGSSASSAIVRSAKAHPERRRREPSPAAGVAGRVRAVPRQQHPDVDLVALGLEPVEEALHAVEVAAALDQDLALVGREARHGDVRADGVAAAGAEEVRRRRTRRPACSRARPAARRA